MKTKLTLSLDEHLVPVAKEFARAQGVSLSQMIEVSLRTMVHASREGAFSRRWRGALRPARKNTPRYRTLAQRYLCDS